MLIPQDERELAIEILHAATALYTTTSVVDVLLDRIGWPDADGKLIDPSAGDGAFLVQALARLSTPKDDLVSLSRVHGWELHPGAVASGRERIVRHLQIKGWTLDVAQEGARRVIHEGDFLTDGPKEGCFRFIAGNPPFMRFGHLPEFFKSIYRQVLPDVARGDLLHAFLERCVQIMPEDGIIGCISSDRWLINETSANLRRCLGQKVGISHVARLDASTSFYQPKSRRRGSPPRIHPVEIVLQPSKCALQRLTDAPVSPDGVVGEVAETPVLGDIATVRIAPWLGPHGIFVLDADKATALPQAELVPAVDTDDVDPEKDQLGTPTRYAIRTRRDIEPSPEVQGHLRGELGRMPKRGQRSTWWMPPETITLSLNKPALLIPRIGKRIRPIRLPAGILPINHNLYIIEGSGSVSLDAIEDILRSSATHAWLERNAPRLENGYFDIRSGLIRRIPVTDHSQQIH
ncbi:Eco57I restriction-modification methylase domain-containing protein [Microvirga tunisiensis]|nr:N-6 DNA methylase [Microvirga tunisiensis]